MTKKMQKKIEVFKLEERVLFDAAAAADIVEAMQNDPAVQNQQSEQERQAQEEQNALKNAAPENLAARAEEEAKNAAQPTTTESVASADPDAAVQALVEGAVPVSEVVDVEDAETGAVELTGEADSVEMNGEAADVDDDAVFVEAFTTPAAEADRELVIINSSIRDKEAFIEEAGKNADILILDPADDAMAQINEFLDAQDGKYSSVHVITHGNEGYFLLNGEVVTADSVAQDPASWAAIGEHLTDDADIMLYSCNLTGNMEGQALATQIAELTGADVAASSDITGQGGDWQFEYQLGVTTHEFYKPVHYSHSLVAITVNGDLAADDAAKYQFNDLQSALNVGGGNDITIVKLSTADRGTYFNISGERVINNSGATLNIGSVANATLQGSFNFGNGAIGDNVTFNGLGVTLSDAQLSAAGYSININGGSVTLEGSWTAAFGSNGNLNWNAAANITIATGSELNITNTLNNAGTLTVNGTLSVAQNLTNSGSLTNVSTLDVTGSLTNSGRLTNSGVLNIAKDLTNSGSLTNASSLDVTGSLANSGTLTNRGTLTVGDTFGNFNTFTNTGSAEIFGDFTNYDAHALTNNGNLTVHSNFANYGTVTNAGGSLTIDGDLVNGGITNGTINNIGQDITETVFSVGGNVTNLQGSTINNRGYVHAVNAPQDAYLATFSIGGNLYNGGTVNNVAEISNGELAHFAAGEQIYLEFRVANFNIGGDYTYLTTTDEHGNPLYVGGRLNNTAEINTNAGTYSYTAPEDMMGEIADNMGTATLNKQTVAYELSITVVADAIFSVGGSMTNIGTVTNNAGRINVTGAFNNGAVIAGREYYANTVNNGGILTVGSLFNAGGSTSESAISGDGEGDIIVSGAMTNSGSISGFRNLVLGENGTGNSTNNSWGTISGEGDIVVRKGATLRNEGRILTTGHLFVQQEGNGYTNAGMEQNVTVHRYHYVNTQDGFQSAVDNAVDNDIIVLDTRFVNGNITIAGKEITIVHGTAVQTSFSGTFTVGSDATLNFGLSGFDYVSAYAGAVFTGTATFNGNVTVAGATAADYRRGQTYVNGLTPYEEGEDAQKTTYTWYRYYDAMGDGVTALQDQQKIDSYAAINRGDAFQYDYAPWLYQAQSFVAAGNGGAVTVNGTVTGDGRILAQQGGVITNSETGALNFAGDIYVENGEFYNYGIIRGMNTLEIESGKFYNFQIIEGAGIADSTIVVINPDEVAGAGLYNLERGRISQITLNIGGIYADTIADVECTNVWDVGLNNATPELDIDLHMKEVGGYVYNDLKANIENMAITVTGGIHDDRSTANDSVLENRGTIGAGEIRLGGLAANNVVPNNGFGDGRLINYGTINGAGNILVGAGYRMVADFARSLAGSAIINDGSDSKFEISYNGEFINAAAGQTLGAAVTVNGVGYGAVAETTGGRLEKTGNITLEGGNGSNVALFSNEVGATVSGFRNMYIYNYFAPGDVGGVNNAGIISGSGAITVGNVDGNNYGPQLGRLINTATGRVDMTGIITVYANSVVQNDGAEFSSGNMDVYGQLINNGELNIIEGASLNIYSPLAQTSVNNGAIGGNGNLNVAGIFTNSADAAINLHGSITLQNGFTFNNYGTISEFGSMRIAGPAGNAVAQNTFFNNYGTVSGAGDITVENTSAVFRVFDAGVVTVAANRGLTITAGLLENAGMVDGEGNIDIGGQGKLTNNATVAVSGDINVVLGGTFANNAELTGFNNLVVAAGGAIANMGNISGNGDVTINGTATGEEGTVTMQEGSTFTYNSTTAVFYNGTYYDLTFNAGSRYELTENVRVNGVLSTGTRFSGDIYFEGAHTYDAGFEESASVNMLGGRLHYTNEATEIRGGTYNDLVIYRPANGTVRLNHNVTVNGGLYVTNDRGDINADANASVTTDTAVLANGTAVTLTLNGRISGVDRFAGHTDAADGSLYYLSVVYGESFSDFYRAADKALYFDFVGGDFYDLTVNTIGGNTLDNMGGNFAGDLNVQRDLVLNGSYITLSGADTIGRNLQINGSFITVDGGNTAVQGNLVVGDGAEDVTLEDITLGEGSDFIIGNSTRLNVSRVHNIGALVINSTDSVFSELAVRDITINAADVEMNNISGILTLTVNASARNAALTGLEFAAYTDDPESFEDSFIRVYADNVTLTRISAATAAAGQKNALEEITVTGNNFVLEGMTNTVEHVVYSGTGTASFAGVGDDALNFTGRAASDLEPAGVNAVDVTRGGTLLFTNVNMTGNVNLGNGDITFTDVRFGNNVVISGSGEVVFNGTLTIEPAATENDRAAEMAFASGTVRYNNIDSAVLNGNYHTLIFGYENGTQSANVWSYASVTAEFIDIYGVLTVAAGASVTANRVTVNAGYLDDGNAFGGRLNVEGILNFAGENAGVTVESDHEADAAATAAGTLEIAAGGEITSEGTYEVELTHGAVFSNFGTLSGAGNLRINTAAIGNAGAKVNSGAIALTGNIVLNGAFTNAATGAISGFSSMDVAATGTLTNDGVINVGTADDPATTDVDESRTASLTVQGGVLNGTGNLEVFSGSSVAFGMAEEQGALTLKQGVITLNDGSILTLEGNTANKVLTLADTAILVRGGEVQILGFVSLDGADASVINAGTLTVEGGYNTFNGMLANSGTVNLNGTAEFNDAVTNAGTMNLAGAAEFNGDVANAGVGIITVNGTAAFGALENSGDLVLMNGSTATFGALENSGTMNLNGTATFNGAVNNLGHVTVQTNAVNFANGISNGADGVLEFNVADGYVLGSETLIGVNGSFLGELLVSGGTLTLNLTGAMQFSGITVNTDAVLAMEGVGATASEVIIGAEGDKDALLTLGGTLTLGASGAGDVNLTVYGFANGTREGLSYNSGKIDVYAGDKLTLANDATLQPSETDARDAWTFDVGSVVLRRDAQFLDEGGRMGNLNDRIWTLVESQEQLLTSGAAGTRYLFTVDYNITAASFNSTDSEFSIAAMWVAGAGEEPITVTLDSGLTLTVGGLIRVDAGDTLALNNSVLNAAAGQITLDGVMSGSGTLNVTSTDENQIITGTTGRVDGINATYQYGEGFTPDAPVNVLGGRYNVLTINSGAHTGANVSMNTLDAAEGAAMAFTTEVAVGEGEELTLAGSGIKEFSSLVNNGTVKITGLQSFGNEFAGANGSLEVADGAMLTVIGSDLNLGTAVNAGTVVLAANHEAFGADFTNDGTVEVTAGAEVVFNGGVWNGSIENTGSLTLSNSAVNYGTVVNNDNIILNGGLFNDFSNASTAEITADYTLTENQRWENTGDVVNRGSLTLKYSHDLGAFYNGGRVVLDTPYTDFGNGFYNYAGDVVGTLEIAAGAEVSMAAGNWELGTITVAQGGLLTLQDASVNYGALVNNGTLNLAGGDFASIINNGRLNFNSNYELTAGLREVTNNGTAALSSTYTLTVSIGNWDSGNFVNDGTLVLNANHEAFGANFTNNGLVQVTAGAEVVFNGGVWNGSIENAGDLTLENAFNYGSIENAGTLNLAGGMFASLNNREAGAVSITADYTLGAGQELVNSGSITLADGSTLTLKAALVLISGANASFINNGTVQLDYKQGAGDADFGGEGFVNNSRLEVLAGANVTLAVGDYTATGSFIELYAGSVLTVASGMNLGNVKVNGAITETRGEGENAREEEIVAAAQLLLNGNFSAGMLDNVLNEGIVRVGEGYEVVLSGGNWVNGTLENEGSVTVTVANLGLGEFYNGGTLRLAAAYSAFGAGFHNYLKITSATEGDMGVAGTLEIGGVRVTLTDGEYEHNFLNGNVVRGRVVVEAGSELTVAAGDDKALGIVENAGKVNLNASYSSFGANFTNYIGDVAGTLNIEQGKTVVLNGGSYISEGGAESSVTNNGTLTLETAGVNYGIVTNAGELNLLGGQFTSLTNYADATVNISGDYTLNDEHRLEKNEGTISLYHGYKLTVAKENITLGTFSNYGEVWVTADQESFGIGFSTVVNDLLNFGVLYIGADVTLVGGEYSSDRGSGVINVLNGGTLTVTAHELELGRLNNGGTVRMEANNLNSRFGVDFNNYYSDPKDGNTYLGTLEIAEGYTVTLAGGRYVYDNAGTPARGTIRIENGAKLNVGEALADVDLGIVQNAGTLQLNNNYRSFGANFTNYIGNETGELVIGGIASVTVTGGNYITADGNKGKVTVNENATMTVGTAGLQLGTVTNEGTVVFAVNFTADDDFTNKGEVTVNNRIDLTLTGGDWTEGSINVEKEGSLTILADDLALGSVTNAGTVYVLGNYTNVAFGEGFSNYREVAGTTITVEIGTLIIGNDRTQVNVLLGDGNFTKTLVGANQQETTYNTNVQVSAGSTLTVSAANNFKLGKLVNDGTLVLDTNYSSFGANFTNNGQVQVGAGNSVVMDNGTWSANSSIINDGTLTLANAGINYGVVTNNETLNLAGGQFRSLANTGTLNLLANYTFADASMLQLLSGTINLAAGAMLTVTVANLELGEFYNGGTLVLAADYDAFGIGFHNYYNAAGGTLVIDGADVTLVDGAFVDASGSSYGTINVLADGQLTVAAGADFALGTVNNGGIVRLEASYNDFGAGFANFYGSDAGTLEIAAGAEVTLSEGVFTYTVNDAAVNTAIMVEAGASLTVAAEDNFDLGSVTNAGTLILNNNYADGLTFDINNSGTVKINSTVLLNSGVWSNSGVIENNAVLTLAPLAGNAGFGNVVNYGALVLAGGLFNNLTNGREGEDNSGVSVEILQDYTLDGTATLVNYGDITLGEGITLTLNAMYSSLGVFTNNGTVVLNADYTDAGLFAEFTNNNLVQIGADAAVMLDGGMWADGSIANMGTLTVDAADDFDLGSVTNDGTLILNNNYISGLTFELVNNGTLILNGSVLLNSGVWGEGSSVVNNGTLSLEEGSNYGAVINNSILNLNGGAFTSLTNNATGTANILADYTFSNDQQLLNNSGLMTLVNGKTLTVQDTAVALGAFENAGLVQLNADYVAEGMFDGFVNMVGGYVAIGEGAAVRLDAGNWSDGTIGIFGTLTVGADMDLGTVYNGGTMVLAANYTRELNKFFNYMPLLDETGTPTGNFLAGVLEIAEGAEITLASGNYVAVDGSMGTVLNRGALTLNALALNASYGNVANYGALTLNGGAFTTLTNAGTADIAVDYTLSDAQRLAGNTGTITLAEGVMLDMQADQALAEGSGSFINNGTVALNVDFAAFGTGFVNNSLLEVNASVVMDGGDWDNAGSTINNTGELTLAVAALNTLANTGTLKLDTAALTFNTITNDNSVTALRNSTLNGTMQNNGSITTAEDAVLTFAGETLGEGTVEGAFAYSFANGAVYDGIYSALTIDANVTLDGSATVNGAFVLNGTLSGSDAAVELVINGANSGEGSLNMADGTVTYGDTATGVFGGAYNNLVLNGDHELMNDFAVNGTANVNGEMTGSADVEFNGTTEGNGTFAMTGGAVIYSATAEVVFGGEYYNLILTDVHELVNDFTVNGAANLSGEMTGTANVTFNGANSGEGTMNMTGGTVTYGDTATGVFGGIYNNLVLTGAHTLANDFAVNGAANFSGEQSGTADVTFNGTNSGEGTLNMTSGTVTYGDTATGVFGGVYHNLVLAAGNRLVNDFTVNGIANFTGEMTGSANVTFNGTTEGDSSFAMSAGAVTYSAGVDVFGGSYNDLVLNGAHDLTTDITVNGNAAFTGVQRGTANVTFNGTSSGEGTMNMTGGTVTYGASATGVFGGTYNDLVLTGAHELTNNFTVNGAANFSGVQTGTANVTFNGTTAGNGSFDMTGGTVTYGATAANVFGGVYNGLTVIGAHALNTNLTVNGLFSIQAAAATSGSSSSATAITGSGVLTLNGRTQLASGVTFANTGTVIYDTDFSGTGITGTYNNLTVNGNVTLGAITLGGIVNGSGTVVFSELITAAKDTTPTVNSDAITVTYAQKSTNVLGGTYGNLILNGSHALTNNVTVMGDLTAYRNINGSAAVISGSSILEVHGKLVNFDRDADHMVAKLEMSGITRLYGESYEVTNSTFGALEFNGSDVTFRDTTLNGRISGTGSMTIEEGVSGSGTFDMTGGTVTYTLNANVPMAGRYYNLTVNYEHLTISNSLDVRNLFTADSETVTIAAGGSLTTLKLSNRSGLFGTTEITIQSGGHMTLGWHLLIGSPDNLNITAKIENFGNLTVNHGGYNFIGEVTNNGGGNFTVNYIDGDDNVTLQKFNNYYGANATFNSPTIIAQIGSEDGWTNYGNLTLLKLNNFGFEDGFAIENANGATLTLGAGEYTFTDTNYLLNAGTVRAVDGGEITFQTLDERLGGSLAYQTVGLGVMNFNITGGTALNDGVRGALYNGGTMNLNTENMHYYGTVSNSGAEESPAIFMVNAKSIFEGAVTRNMYGLIAVMDTAAGTVFQNTVNTGSAFYILGSTTFNKAVNVAGIFEIDAATTFNGTLTVSISDDVSSSVGDANTTFTVNAATVFNDAVLVQNLASTTPWNVVFTLNAKSNFNSTVMNYSENGASHRAEFIVNGYAAGTTFNEIINEGAGAEFRVYSVGNAFNGAITNTRGLFELNAANSLAAMTNTGYLRINHGASGASIGALTSSGTVSIFAGDNGEATLFEFTDTVTTSGYFNIEAEGVSFRKALTNSGVLNVRAATAFNVAIDNSGEFNIKANNVTFSKSVNNSGTMTVARDITGVVFSGEYTIAEGGSLHLGGVDTVFNGNVINAGSIYAEGGKDYDDNTYGNLINGTLFMQSGSALYVGESGELTLNRVEDAWRGTVDSSSYTLVWEWTETVDDGIVEHMYWGRISPAAAEAFRTDGTIPEALLADLPDGAGTPRLESTPVFADGVQPRMTVADGGILRFLPQVFVQTIHSHLEVAGDGDVQYVYGKTIFADIDYTDWIMISSNTVITEYGKYRVMDGGSVLVDGDAFGSHFRVMAGGTLTVNAGDNLGSLVNQDGLVNVNGGEYDIAMENVAGTFNVTDATFNGEFYNAGTMTAINTQFKADYYNVGNLTVGSTGFEAALYNYGTLTVLDGANSISNLVNDGSTTVAAGAAADLEEVTNNGSFTVNGEAVIGTMTDDSDSSMTVNGAVTFGSESEINGLFSVNGGEVSGAALSVKGETSGDDATFNNAVSYDGEDQSVISGTYNDALTITGTGAKVEGDVTADNITVTGDLAVAEGGTLNTNKVEGAVDSNAGTINVEGKDAAITVTDNSGALNMTGDDARADVGNNTGDITVTGNNAGVTVEDNSGAVNMAGNNGSANVEDNSGSITVTGDNAAISGTNNGSITVNGKDAAISGTNNGNVAVNGSASISGTDTEEAVYDVNGTLTVDMDDNKVKGQMTTHDGEVILADETAFDQAMKNNGTLTVSADAEGSNLAKVEGEGTINLNATVDFGSEYVNEGDLNINVTDQDLSGVTNEGKVTFTTDETLTEEIAGNGTVAAGNGATLTVDAGDELNGNYSTEEGSSLAVSGDTAFNGSVSNEGTVDADGKNITFNGATEGSGSVVNAGDKTTYNAAAENVFSGDYQGLAVNNNASVGGDVTVAGPMELNGTLSTEEGASITFNGATEGTGSMAGGEGSVIYGENSDSSVYNGAYNNVTFNNDAVLDGDATISGNASVDANGSFSAQNGTVNYNGAQDQTVATGTYDNLTLSNGGSKVFEAGSESTVNGALNVQGSTSALTPMVSSGAEQFSLNFDQSKANFHYAYINGLKVDGHMNLDGTNRVGNNNSGIDTFNAASGIGDMFPDMLNSNLSAVSFSLGNEMMNARMYESQLLEEFRRRRSAVDTVTDSVSDIRLESTDNEDLLAEAGDMLDDAIQTLSSSSISVLGSELAANEVVASSGAFQDDLDEALEAIIKE